MLLIDLLVANASSKKHYPDLARASSVWNFCARTIGASLFQALRSWERRERKRHAKSCRGGKKEKGRERELLSPVSSVILFALSLFRGPDYLGAWNRLHRPRPRLSGYFWIRNFFFPDTKISAATHIRIFFNPQIFLCSNRLKYSR